MGVLDASTSPPKERYAVSNDNVIQLIQPGIFDDLDAAISHKKWRRKTVAITNNS